MQVVPRYPHWVSELFSRPSRLTQGCERRPKIPRASWPSMMTKLLPGFKYFQTAARAPERVWPRGLGKAEKHANGCPVLKRITYSMRQPF